jgi:hypothetical protein
MIVLDAPGCLIRESGEGCRRQHTTSSRGALLVHWLARHVFPDGARYPNVCSATTLTSVIRHANRLGSYEWPHNLNSCLVILLSCSYVSRTCCFLPDLYNPLLPLIAMTISTVAAPPQSSGYMLTSYSRLLTEHRSGRRCLRPCQIPRCRSRPTTG